MNRYRWLCRRIPVSEQSPKLTPISKWRRNKFIWATLWYNLFVTSQLTSGLLLLLLSWTSMFTILFFSCRMCVLLNIYIGCFTLLTTDFKKKPKINNVNNIIVFIIFLLRHIGFVTFVIKALLFIFGGIDNSISNCVIWKRHKINHGASFNLYYYDH